MNWNYSSADFEESLYEDVQGPEEGGETGGERQIEVTEEHDGQRGQDNNGAPVESDILNHAEGGGKVRKTNVQAGIEKSTYRYENVIELPMVPMPLGSINNEEKGRYGGKETRKNGEDDDANSETPKNFAEGVKEAIAKVEVAYEDGEKRLVKVLEDLEDQMLAEKAEEEELMLRVHQLYEVTPRRSARLAKKRLDKQRLEPKE